jgi:hypothetical protein
MADSGSTRDRRLILARLADRFVDELQVSAAAIALTIGESKWLPAYATNETATDLEQFAFTVGEGPCDDALRSHGPVLVPDLSAATATARWPLWSVAAGEAGIGSVAAFPVQAGAITAGVLTAYFTNRGPLSRDQVRTGLHLADAALLGLLDLAAGLQRDENETDDGDDELSAVLRADVHLAAGMVMAQADVTIDEALARLRAHAFSTGRALTAVAKDVVNRRMRFEPDRHSAE